MNKYNHSRWFATVTDAMHIRILAEFGYGDFLGTALDERALSPSRTFRPIRDSWV